MINIEYNEIQLTRILNVTEKFHNLEILSLLRKWANSSEPLKIVGMNKRENGEFYPKGSIIANFILFLHQFIENESDLNWEKYCLIQHRITTQIDKTSSKKYRSLLRSLYIFASEEASNMDVRKFLLHYSKLFLDKELTTIRTQRKLSSSIDKNVRTNFPLTSKANQIIQINCYNIAEKKEYTVHFFTSTDNEYLLELLSSFNQYLFEHFRKKFNSLDHRLFITLFADSLGDKQVNSIDSFNEETFKTQLLFYKKKIHQLEWDEEIDDIRIKGFLIKFYLYIDELYYNKQNFYLFLTESFNRDMMRMPNFTKYIEEEYSFTIRTEFENMPESDKWVLLPQRARGAMNVRLNRVTTLDFTVVKNVELRKELKNWIWVSKCSNQETKGRIFRLSMFLNEAINFYENERKVTFINFDTKAKLFSTYFLILYYSSIVSNENYSNGTKNLTISWIRNFLEFIGDKYDIPTLVIKQLSYLETDESGGTPITEVDFKEIQNVFKNNADSIEGELVYIAFQLSLTTKLRIGEVLSLKRDCVVSKNEQKGFGIIRYFSKTSFGELVQDVFLLEHIRLIERAIYLTHSAFEVANEDMKLYIFICNDKTRKGRIISLLNIYTDSFRKTISELYNSGKIKKKYTPYNARHTFIDNAWQGVEDGIISTVEITSITGNTANTAIKHYRNRDNIQRYIEAMYEVSIKNIDVSGLVIESEDTIKDLPPVHQNAGGCSSGDCIKVEVDIEDSEYICLTCSKFVTTINRAHLFEEKILRYKQNREQATSKSEKNFFTGLIELNSAYLAQIYLLMEKSNNE